MKITIVYDNTASIPGVTSDWGFSCVIEVDGQTILFDTGENGRILLDNMKALHVEPRSVQTVFLSHSHFDHSGGLSEFLNVNRQVTIYAPIALRGIHRASEVVYVEHDTPFTLLPQIHSTGLLRGIEQSLVIATKKGVVVIAGCSHSGVKTILTSAVSFGKPYALIGGLHGFEEYDILQNMEYICPTHCTRHKDEIQKRYPDSTFAGGVGTIIELS